MPIVIKHKVASETDCNNSYFTIKEPGCGATKKPLPPAPPGWTGRSPTYCLTETCQDGRTFTPTVHQPIKNIHHTTGSTAAGPNGPLFLLAGVLGRIVRRADRGPGVPRQGLGLGTQRNDTIGHVNYTLAVV